MFDEVNLCSSRWSQHSWWISAQAHKVTLLSIQYTWSWSIVHHTHLWSYEGHCTIAYHNFTSNVCVWATLSIDIISSAHVMSLDSFTTNLYNKHPWEWQKKPAVTDRWVGEQMVTNTVSQRLPCLSCKELLLIFDSFVEQLLLQPEISKNSIHNCISVATSTNQLRTSSAAKCYIGQISKNS